VKDGITTAVIAVALLAAPLIGYRVGVNNERAKWQAEVARLTAETKAREHRDRQEVEAQNRADRLRIEELEAHLAAALAPRPDPAPRIVRVCDTRPGPATETEADAGTAAEGGAAGRPVPDAADPWGALLELRADLLTFAKECAVVREAALSAKEQWPR
jgi:hypothetical protein